MEKLSIALPAIDGQVDLDVVHTLASCLGKVQYLKLTHLSTLARQTLTDAAVEALATHCSALRSLIIAAGTAVTNAALTHLMVTRDSMRRLQVAVQQDVKDLQRRLCDAGIQVVCHLFANGMVNVTRSVEKPENVDEEDEDFDY